ncbi:MAG: hypothetical protein V3V08_24915 [Nannocystaceae bacterium]
MIEQLAAPDRAALELGRHTEVAERLAARGDWALAGWVLEQIWNFSGATIHYLEASAYPDALRTAVESGDGDLLDRTLNALHTHATIEQRRAAATLLYSRGRHLESSRLAASVQDIPSAQANALAAAGDRLSAAQVLLSAGDLHGALKSLHLDGARVSAPELALAARITWDLGDTEGTVRHAQAALRLDEDAGLPVATLLGRALGTLGYDLAAQLVLGRDHAEAELPPTRGRYTVTGTLPTQLAGAAYTGVDRVTLQEVELHLLLREYSRDEAHSSQLLTAVDRFFHTAQAASELDHPAIRPVLRHDAEQGLLVLPRAEEASLRALIRPPGLAENILRAKSLLAFLLRGLFAAHRRGIVHGQILPLHIVGDALGRPLLGPFGAHHLAGLVATHTAGLEEILAFTPPEQRRGEAPTSASDIFSLGAIYRSVLLGCTRGRDAALPTSERSLIAEMTATDPDERPPARAVLDRLDVQVADIAQLRRDPGQRPVLRDPARRPVTTGVEQALTVLASTSWKSDELDALASARCPWLQTILDREHRTFHLAAWPEGCRRVGTRAPWPTVAQAAMENIPDALRSPLEKRLHHDAFVLTPAGECMIALDSVLAR